VSATQRGAEWGRNELADRLTRTVDAMGEVTDEDAEIVREGYVEWLGHKASSAEPPV
jgi:hypothetical protein